MSERETQSPVQWEFDVPGEIRAGVYANMLSIWHTAYEFTLDFAATQPPIEDEDGVTIPCLITARVKVPVTVLFDVPRAQTGRRGVAMRVSTSVNVGDVPVMPDPRIVYKPGARGASSYIVKPNPRPAPRPDRKDDRR